MNLKTAACVMGAVMMTVTGPAVAQQSATTPLVNPDVGVPVFPHDLQDRPYQVLGEVRAPVRKTTIFSKAPSQQKVYKELWERGQKLGADAVINAKYGDARVTALSWGEVAATGTAVKFTAAATTAAPVSTEATAPAAAADR